MLKRFLASFLRWLLNAWEKGEVDEARKAEKWEDSRSGFRGAVKRWREK